MEQDISINLSSEGVAHAQFSCTERVEAEDYRFRSARVLNVLCFPGAKAAECIAERFRTALIL